ncbi:MAG: DsbA family protein [Chloroflexi bacterium]|nr:DsbA family protein [Chloroflexota bacterium]
MARLDQLREEFPLEIDYKSFYLRPDIPPQGIVREPRPGSEPGTLVSGHLGEVAEEANIVMRRAPITPNTRLSFEASEFAKEKGLFEPFHRVCYKAFWEDGVNLGDIPVLQRLGEQVGLDPQEMKERLDTGHYTAQAETQYKEALAIGVRGIPSFIMGRYFFSGAQPYEFFQHVAQLVQKEQKEGVGEGEG